MEECLDSPSHTKAVGTPLGDIDIPHLSTAAAAFQ